MFSSACVFLLLSWPHSSPLSSLIPVGFIQSSRFEVACRSSSIYFRSFLCVVWFVLCFVWMAAGWSSRTSCLFRVVGGVFFWFLPFSAFFFVDSARLFVALLRRRRSGSSVLSFPAVPFVLRLVASIDAIVPVVPALFSSVNTLDGSGHIAVPASDRYDMYVELLSTPYRARGIGSLFCCALLSRVLLQV